MLSKILPRTIPKAKAPWIVAYNNEVRAIQLKPFKRIHFQFDPFHPKVASIREFLQHIDRKQIRKTNLKCVIRTDVLSDGREPTIVAQLEEGKKIVFKTANLSSYEILQYFNKYTVDFSPE